MNLFESASLKNITLKNRFLRSASSEKVSTNGYPDAELLGEMYRKLVEGNVGTILTGFCFVAPEGQCSPTQNGMHEDGVIPVWQKIIEKSGAQDRESSIFAQIVHGGRLVSFPTDKPQLVPSEVSVPVPENTVRVMDKEDIHHVRRAFVDATRRAVKAGCDGVQLHCAHGYLLNQFLSPALNKRSDEYGGNAENRSRLVVEILQEIRDEHPDLPLAVKINGCDYISNGLVPTQTSEVISFIKEFSLEFYEVSGWMWQGDESKMPSRKVDPKIPGDEGYFYEDTLALKKDHPEENFALCGGVRSLRFCEQALKDFELLSMSRPFISQPHLVQLFQESKTTRTRCISCNQCMTAGPDKGLQCVYFENKRKRD